MRHAHANRAAGASEIEPFQAGAVQARAAIAPTPPHDNRPGTAPPLCENPDIHSLHLPNGVRMTTHITIEFTEHAAETIGEQTSTSFSYDQGAHVPQPGDFVELENSRQTFLVIGRVFSLKANYCAVKLVLDLPPADEHEDFGPAH
jgi:hypothetical protein